jgi:hypothetical protein
MIELSKGLFSPYISIFTTCLGTLKFLQEKPPEHLGTTF